MLTLATLDLLLSINESELIEEIILALLGTPQLVVFFGKFPRLKNALLKDLPSWQQILQQKIKQTLIPASLAEEFQLYQHIQSIDTADFYQQLPNIVEKLQQLESPFAKEADTLLKVFSESTSSEQILFIQRWRRSLILQTTAFNKTLLEQEKEQLLAEIQKRLTLSGNLDPIFDHNDHAAGRLWDMSKGQLHLTTQNIRLLTLYADFLKQQPELEKLAQLLGRSRAAQSIPKENPILKPFTRFERIPDTIPEQISGIRQSDDILRLLPTELAMLGIEELQYEFYRRLVEKKLLSYHLQGDDWQTKTTLKPITHHHNKKQPQGPFIICVDTSGSMGGFNEQCAKAFCLALMRIALADNRHCHIMLFSTQLVHYDLTSPDGLTQAMHFLGQTFRGGTDLASCLDATVKKMKENTWEDADAVVISDFIAQRLPGSLIHQIKNLQQHQQHRFHAISLSHYGKPGIMQIFNHIWHFDTGLTSRLRRRWRN
ncbi:ATPase RavA stimulator ViaA [Xenorhabdus eapokensis]|uniref:Regulatory protein ViaA n=1 Tax=Xenorhabdus eapokensis TaxID=1873482 RepID=A0A1Q5TNQ5_9GAMM|nr:ATPase RavA stimulator ViaA [Xenorhabdus eapokensis]OKP01856.1 protoheme IX farnesyltransferase [Xenorhabdus eapokensis]